MKDQHHIPPKFAQRFLQWFLKEQLAEEVMGDLEEHYYHNLRTTTKLKSNLKYWYQVFNYLRPFAISIFRSTHSNYFAMYKNYFKIGYRNLLKNKGYSLINIGGLAIGMTVAMLISLWLNDELSFNKYHQNYDKVVKVLRQDEANSEIYVNTAQVRGLGSVLRNEYEDYFSRVAMVRARLENRVIARGNRKFTQPGYFMGPDGPEIFSLKMLAGTRNGLEEMNSIMLSASLATKLFGDKEALNQVVKLDAGSDLKVTGIYEDLPLNTEFHEATYFIPFEKYIEGWGDNGLWNNQFVYIFAQLQENIDFATANDRIKNAMKAHVPENYNRTVPTLRLHAMKDWHLYHEFENGVNATSDQLKFVWFYAIIGMFILLLACINFMNLSTARSEKRSKEVGVRKSMGSLRTQLINQFLTESFLVAILAFVLGIVLLLITLPWFNAVSGKDMEILWLNPWFWVGGLAFTVFTALMAGSYPAFYLSSFNPVSVLKGSVFIGKSASLPRKILVVFQFTISIALVIGTIIVNKQIQFVKERPVGYAKEGLISFRPGSPEFYGKYEALRNEMKKTGVVEEIAEANYPITSTLGNNSGFNWEGKDPDLRTSFNTIYVKHEYGKTVGWKFLAGRDFSRDFKNEAQNLVITESVAKLMGFENPIGQAVHYDQEWVENKDFTIIGVIKDQIKGSPYDEARPAIMFCSERDMGWLFIRMKPEADVRGALAKIETAFNNVVPSAPFDFKFVDDEYDTKFQAEERVSALAEVITFIAVFISCLGLLGLASYIAEKRTKEIGIRKVLGASISEIWQLLTKDFMVLVLLAGLIAIPAAALFFKNWLSQYEYRMEIPLWIFIGAALGALVLTLITISFQAIRSARANPVKALRSE